MKKSNIIVIVIVLIVVIGVGLLIYFVSGKECKDLNEQQCKKDDSCLSVLVPCTGPSCTNQAVFKECKDKESK
jgi:flagellar basal body-associated protein FliL